MLVEAEVVVTLLVVQKATIEVAVAVVVLLSIHMANPLTLIPIMFFL